MCLSINRPPTCELPYCRVLEKIFFPEAQQYEILQLCTNVCPHVSEYLSSYTPQTAVGKKTLGQP